MPPRGTYGSWDPVQTPPHSVLRQLVGPGDRKAIRKGCDIRTVKIPPSANPKRSPPEAVRIDLGVRVNVKFFSLQLDDNLWREKISSLLHTPVLYRSFT